MTETVLIYDEAESRAATEAQMHQTARMYGLQRGSQGPVTEPGGPRASSLPQRVETPPALLVNPSFPPLPPSLALPPALTDHLLITPAGRAGLVRLVRMQGSAKLGSWTLHEDAAGVAAAILVDFGIQLTDLRESEEPDGQSV